MTGPEAYNLGLRNLDQPIMNTTVGDPFRAARLGFRLGRLNSDALRRLTAQAYAEMPLYQSREYNRAGLAPWEDKILDRFFSTCNSILLAAAGGGREAIGLFRRGLQVDAFECCPTLVTTSRSLLADEGISMPVMESKPDRVPNNLGVYDGLIVGWGGYLHILGRPSRIRFLQDLHPHVAGGGPLLLSFFCRDTDDGVFLLAHRVAQLIRQAKRIRDPVEVGDAISTTFDHHFTQQEVDAELLDAGFRLIYYADIELEYDWGERYAVAVARAR